MPSFSWTRDSGRRRWERNKKDKLGASKAAGGSQRASMGFMSLVPACLPAGRLNHGWGRGIPQAHETKQGEKRTIPTTHLHAMPNAPTLLA